MMFGWLFERRYLNDAGFIHAISSADVEGVKAYGAHNRFVTAPNCIDPSLMPREVDRDLSFAERRLRSREDVSSLYSGPDRSRTKGPRHVHQGLGLAPSSRHLALLLVGPDWRQGRSAIACACRCSRNRETLSSSSEPVSGKEKWDLLASADVFVHPSRWEAGVPFSVLEAMVAAKPLLLTEPADPDGLVVGGEAGFVAPPERRIRKALTGLRMQMKATWTVSVWLLETLLSISSAGVDDAEATRSVPRCVAGPLREQGSSGRTHATLPRERSMTVGYFDRMTQPLDDSRLSRVKRAARMATAYRNPLKAYRHRLLWLIPHGCPRRAPRRAAPHCGRRAARPADHQ